MGIMIQIKKSNNKTMKWDVLFRPFAWEVWALLLFTMIMSGLVYYLIDFITYRGNKEKIDKSISDSLFYSFQVLTGTSKYNPTYAPNRILLISLRLLCIIIVAAFTSNLTAFLIDDSNVINVNVFEDAIYNNYRICVLRGSGTVVEIQRQHPTGLYVEKENRL